MTTRHALAATCLGLLWTGLTACSSGLTAPTAPSSPTAPATAPTPPMAPPRLFGTVTELTADGPVPIPGVYIEYCGYDSAVTDENGFYQLMTVPNGDAWLYVRVAGFRGISPGVTVNGDTRLDLRLERE